MEIFENKRKDKPNKKAINFDLDTQKLYELTGSKTDGYGQIKKFLLKNGFKHKQWSGYVSIEKITYHDVYKLAKELCETFGWFSEVVNTFDVTKVERKGKDFHNAIKTYGNILNQAVSDKETSPKSKPKLSLKEAARKSAEKILRLEKEGQLFDGWDTSYREKSKDDGGRTK
jgi:virulence-associated protein VapD